MIIDGHGGLGGGIYPFDLVGMKPDWSGCTNRWMTLPSLLKLWPGVKNLGLVMRWIGTTHGKNLSFPGFGKARILATFFDSGS